MPVWVPRSMHEHSRMDVPGVEDQNRSRRNRQNQIASESRGAGLVDGPSLAGIRENISEAIRILALRRWYFLVPFCLGTVLATTASHYLPRTYSASTTFERVDDDVLQNLPIRGTVGSFLPFRETFSRDIQSPEIMDEVATAFGLTEDLPKNPDGTLTPEAKEMRRRIGARLLRGVSAGVVSSRNYKDTLRLNYTGTTPTDAVQLLEAARDAYIRQTRVRITQRLQENKTYFEEEAAKRRAVVDALDREKIQREIESPTIDPTRADTIFIKLTSLKNEQRELERQRDTVQAKALKTRQYLGSIVTTSSLPPNSGMAVGLASVLKSPRAREIEAEINRIDTEIEELKIKRRMTDQHPEIVERRELRARYEGLLATEYGPVGPVPNQGLALEDTVGPDASMGDVWRAAKLRAEMDLVAYEDEQERIAGSLRLVGAEIKTLEAARDNVPAARAAYRDLQERLNHAREDYALYAQTAQRFTLLLAADENERGIRFNVLGPTVAGTTPTNPKSKSVLVLALLIGVGAGVVFVLLAELFDRSYHTSKQVVQSLGVNVLETIDEIVTSADRARRFRRKFLLAPAVTVLLLGAAGLSSSMAYLSLEQPATYERLMQKPRGVWQRWTGTREEVPDEHDRIAAHISRESLTAQTPG